MALDPLIIGTRIREIREKRFDESREKFADRCGLKDTHIGQIERGEILVSLRALDKIAFSTGENIDYILYGKCNNEHLQVRKSIDLYLNHSSKEELKMYLECIASIRKFFSKNNKKEKNDKKNT